MRIRGFKRVSEEVFINEFKKEFENYTIEQIQEIYKDLKDPKRATARAAGYDVFSPIAFELKPMQDIKIPIGFKVYMLNDEDIDFFPRSGLGFKYYVRLANTVGIGDSDYYNNQGNEGLYFVKIRNEGAKTLQVKKGEAFAQAIFRKYLLADDDTFTGEVRIGGLGSTTKEN